MKAKLLILHQHTAVVTGRLLQRAEVLVAHCHGLLAKDIQTRRKTVHCDREMRSWRRGNVDKVRTKIGKKVAMGRIGSGDSKTLRSGFSSSRRNVAHSGDVDVIQFGQHCQMLACDSAAAYKNAL